MNKKLLALAVLMALAEYARTRKEESVTMLENARKLARKNPGKAALVIRGWLQENDK